MTTDTAARPVHRFESLLRARELGIAIVIVLVVAITAVRSLAARAPAPPASWRRWPGRYRGGSTA